jgi:Fe-S-cluster-containing hydrogenase component 2/CRP-like cAMP-binding protein
MARSIVMNRPAHLEARDSDVEVVEVPGGAFEWFVRFSLFARLKKAQGKGNEPPPLLSTLAKFPGTLRLRRFRAGQIICRQGEGGWTAFYALTGKEVLAFFEAVPQAARPGEVDDLRKQLAQGPEPGGAAAPVATVYLALARPSQPGRGGLLGTLGRKLFGERAPETKPPAYIPIDAPRAVAYDSKEAPLYEGELFGEMSCLYGTPRSGTIVAGRDCYLLEMLRNILDEVHDDPGYREDMDRVYRERVLGGQLRRLSIFDVLTEEQFERVRSGVELVRFKGGQPICIEGDVSDCMYVVRSGLVKTARNVTALLLPADVADWQVLLAGLAAWGKERIATPLNNLFKSLPAEVRATAGRAAQAPSDEEKRAVLEALNRIITTPDFPDARALLAVEDALGKNTALAEYLRRLPRDRREWPEQDQRKVSRLYVEAVLPGALQPQRPGAGPEYILAYQGQGEFIGEMGLMTGGPRSATCLAYVHPEPGRRHRAQRIAKFRTEEDIVELVRIPRALFEELRQSEAFRRAVNEEIERRLARTKRVTAGAAAGEGRDVVLSERYEELGLVQGQKLMLIDLDRCTRCDECVKACVNTHADGRSRLFLDGPRFFDKYLVPATCRSCRDPVCLIGCPVGSIHRGDNREIVIEDWCIGCGLCADNCPYGSIQMHDIGIIPEGTHGWRYHPAAGLAEGWQGPGFADRGWLPGRTPFPYDSDFRASLAARGAAAEGAICFRYEFRLERAVLASAQSFGLEVTSAGYLAGGVADEVVAVWLNGQPLQAPRGPSRDGVRAYPIAPEGVLQPGRNVVAVRVLPTRAFGVLLDLRLDEERRPAETLGLQGELSEKQVTLRAVVCDLCSGQWGQRPACVTACPHDAALRIDGRTEFPVR